MKNKSYVDCFMLMGTALSVGTGTLPSGRSQSQPLIEDVFTTVVNLSMIIEEVFVVDPKNMIIKVEGILNQKWVDPRLGANVLTRKKAVAGQIWEPKITNVNGENKFEEMIFWRGYGEGNVLLSKKVKIDIRCSTEYRDFPFDSQFCTLKWGSYRFPDEEVTLIWDEVPIDILNEPWTNEFSLSNVTKDIVMDIKPSGNFSTATLQFILKRNFTHYLMCTGVPCILMVLLNYISLWTELDQRWNLNLVSFCCNLYLYYSSICLVYPVSYLKALDIFTGFCTFFSLISLLETFLADSIANLEQKYFSSGNSASFKKYSKMMNLLELGMKVAFPILYLFFVVLYIFVYAT